MPPRPRRRAVGPPGARPSGGEPAPAGLGPDADRAAHRPYGEPADAADDDDRLRADRPPHHDRGV